MIRTLSQVILTSMIIAGGQAAATTCVSLSSIPPSAAPVVRVKLTFVGEQERPIQTVGFAMNPASFDVKTFAPCKKVGVSYGNDALPITVTQLSTTEIANILQAASGVPAVVSGGVATRAYLSFSLYDGAGDRGFEAVIDKPAAAMLVNAIRMALAGNGPALQSLTRFGCFSDLKEPGTPNDVSSPVQVTIGGLRLNRTTGRFVASVTARNNSASSIQGPVSVVFGLSGDVHLFNPTGLTCGTSPEGRGYINLALQNNTMLAGQTVTFPIEIINPNLEPVAPTTKVLAGAGAR